jgi:2-polyprenyl-3-methyl-5-hydroxy-6-metoxy-1,4-benzoquinol methylase
VADAQLPPSERASYDVVTALSSLEHVVHIDKFLDTVFAVLKPGGIAYLNYDDGHFTSHHVKERIMVPVSQVLAFFGIEGSYMKRVRDRDVVRMVHERGGRILDVRKHNLAAMKGFTKKFAKGEIGEGVIRDWLEFEHQLNERCAPSQLSAFLGATIIVVQKP